MEQYKQEFIEFMVDSEVLKFGEFTLKSGRKSPFFMNAGGYVAVHPAEGEKDAYGRAVGAVTNAIESGHRIPFPRGKAKRYRPRIKKARVPGKGMYARTAPQRAAEDAARQLGQQLIEPLEES